MLTDRIPKKVTDDARVAWLIEREASDKRRMEEELINLRQNKIESRVLIKDKTARIDILEKNKILLKRKLEVATQDNTWKERKILDINQQLCICQQSNNNMKTVIAELRSKLEQKFKRKPSHLSNMWELITGENEKPSGSTSVCRWCSVEVSHQGHATKVKKHLEFNCDAFKTHVGLADLEK